MATNRFALGRNSPTLLGSDEETERLERFGLAQREDSGARFLTSDTSFGALDGADASALLGSGRASVAIVPAPAGLRITLTGTNGNPAIRGQCMHFLNDNHA